MTTCKYACKPEFLSTLSLRRATTYQGGTHHEKSNFYPRSPCGERRSGCRYIRRSYAISIHALLAESDCPANWFDLWGWTISIHALLAESDGIGLVFLWWGVRFLSTLSLRRATGCVRYCIHARVISIHALLAESDNRYGRPIDVQLVFLSTLSLRRATTLICEVIAEMTISIHALLAESD